MADILVTSPFQPFTLPTQFKAVFNGYIYCGTVDAVDPSVSQVQVYLVNEAGDKVPVAQPLRTNAGGYLVYNGQPAKFVTDSNHSLLVQDSFHVQAWYVPDMSSADPQTLADELNEFIDAIRGPGGADLIGYGDESVADALDRALSSESIFKKSIALELPFKFPDYETARAFVGSPSYIYPQGHCYDQSGNLFIRYAQGSKATIAWYTSTGVYGGYFYIEAGGESIVITEASGIKKLYSKGGASRLYAYDITNMPANGVLVAFTDVGISSVGLQYTHEAGRWVVEQISADTGVEGSRTKWNVYNDNFVKAGEFFVEKNVVGWQLPESQLYQFVPKSQGACLRGGKMFFGMGGSYIPANDGPQSKPVAAIGVAEVSLDGSLLDYGTLNATKFLNRLVTDGFTAVRTESEGLTVNSSGDISHIIITTTPSSPDASTSGVLVMIERDASGADYSDISEPYVPFDLPRTYAGVFPRSADGAMYNPFTDENMNTMDLLIQYLRNTQTPRISWYTSAVAITPLPGITLPNSQLVEIQNANNLTFIVTISGTGAPTTTYSVTYDKVAFTYSVTKLGTDTAILRVGTGGGATDTVGRVLLPHKATGEEDVLLISGASTASNNNMFIGGISSLFNAATLIDFYTAETTTTVSGAHRLRIDSVGTVRPGVDNTQSLGLGGFRWSVVYAGTGAINTSDAREKTAPLPIDDVVLDAWGDVQLGMFQWLDAIRLKGEDAARWHFGVIAQQVRDAFLAHGLDGTRYGLLCYDEWNDEYEPVFGVRENPDTGEREEYDTGEVKLVRSAGNRWGIRPEQCLFMEAAYHRRRCDRIEARLAAIGA